MHCARRQLNSVDEMGLEGKTQRAGSARSLSTVLSRTFQGEAYVQCMASRYSHWLRAGRPKGRSSSLDRGKIILLSIGSRLAVGPDQPPTQQVPWAPSEGVEWPGREAK
jgi:hypothetical protein